MSYPHSTRTFCYLHHPRASDCWEISYFSSKFIEANEPAHCSRVNDEQYFLTILLRKVKLNYDYRVILCIAKSLWSLYLSGYFV